VTPIDWDCGSTTRSKFGERRPIQWRFLAAAVAVAAAHKSQAGDHAPITKELEAASASRALPKLILGSN